MPFDNEATQYQASKARHRWLWSIQPYQRFVGRATAPKQCRNRNTEGLLQKSAHNSCVGSSYFWDRHILWPQQWCCDVFHPVPTSSLASFSTRRPCTSHFAVLYRYTIQVFDVELFRWRCKWLNADQDLPSNAVQALEECNYEFISCCYVSCQLPEQSFSTLRWLKTYLRATMTGEQESGLALMNIHYGRQIDIGATINIFARKHLRCLLSDILAEWTVNHKPTAFDKCNMLNNYYIIQLLIYNGPSLQEARFTIPS